MKVQFLVAPHAGVIHDMPEDAAQKAIASGKAKAFAEEPAAEAALSVAPTKRSWVRSGGEKA